jgi:hypothetical protein
MFKFFKKIFNICEHNYMYKTTQWRSNMGTIWDVPPPTYQYTEEIYICSKCAKIKKIRY